MDTAEILQNALQVVRQRTDMTPRAALVLGSGLGSIADRFRTETEIPYTELPGFPASTVAGHSGKLVFGYAGSVPVVLMQGRIHYYEGYSAEETVLPVRLAGLLGAKTLLLTNAAGGINPSFSAGTLMLLRDQIATFMPSPLRGKNLWGERFPDMTTLYDEEVASLLLQKAKELNIPLKEGVYIQVPGPQYETPAEIRAFASMGADAVGMSTGCEAIAAGHMGMRVGGISCITNPAAGLGKGRLSHEEVRKNGAQAGEKLGALLYAALETL